jgi:hypothetical protein
VDKGNANNADPYQRQTNELVSGKAPSYLPTLGILARTLQCFGDEAK